MSANPNPTGFDAAIAERLARLEARIAQLEVRIGASGAQAETQASLTAAAMSRAPTEVLQAARESVRNDQIEFEVGENWFAPVGIVILALGALFMLSLPYAGLPAVLPSLAATGAAAALLALARFGLRRFVLLADYLRAVSMALLWFGMLRLAFFGSAAVLAHDALALQLLLAAATAINLSLAWRRNSAWLFTLALALGYASAVIVAVPGFVLGLGVALAATAALASLKKLWSAPVWTATCLGPAVYLNWALGDIARSGAIHSVTSPGFAPGVALLTTIGLAYASWRRLAAKPDAIFAAISASLNCAFGYTAFLIHTGAAFPGAFALVNLAASTALLGIAVMFCRQEHHHASTFFYAMTGYVALSVAILKASEIPNVFVWLATQSLVVVATAVWFRSRFIVVANFAIYVLTVVGYVILKGPETGISLGIGIVALVSARILGWQQGRLELKTELMRNAYLISGFVIFPYALNHLVPSAYVALAWVGLAVVYYGLSLIVSSPKYRWMGHATLLLTTAYLVLVGTRQLDPFYRVVSFLALGTVLLLVSLTFSRLRRRAGPGADPE
jgi:hypothetical protein